jgi:Sigma-70 region 2
VLELVRRQSEIVRAKGKIAYQSSSTASSTATYLPNARSCLILISSSSVPKDRSPKLCECKNHDIVPETALKAFMHFTEFRGEAKFKTWLTSIMRNEVRGRRRRKSTSRTLYFESHKLEQVGSARSADSPDQRYQEKEYGRKLRMLWRHCMRLKGTYSNPKLRSLFRVFTCLPRMGVVC